MEGHGIRDFEAVLDVLRRETDRPIAEVDAVLIVQAILDRANGSVRSPQA